MKVIIKKATLLKHKKTLKIAKLSKIPESSGVTLTASERLLVVGQGFRDEMDCQSLQWGSVTIPYTTWGERQTSPPGKRAKGYYSVSLRVGRGGRGSPLGGPNTPGEH